MKTFSNDEKDSDVMENERFGKDVDEKRKEM